MSEYPQVLAYRSREGALFATVEACRRHDAEATRQRRWMLLAKIATRSRDPDAVAGFVVDNWADIKRVMEG